MGQRKRIGSRRRFRLRTQNRKIAFGGSLGLFRTGVILENLPRHSTPTAPFPVELIVSVSKVQNVIGDSSRVR